MIKIFLIAALAAAVVFAGLWLRERRERQRLYDTLEDMIRAARKGNFTELDFDESRLSRIETEFADYLKTSELSAQATAREKDRIRSLIADISHQTKTPIANLRLYSELLEESDLTDDQRESAEAVHQQTVKLQFLIDALVKLSRLENGIIQLTPEEQDTGAMLRSVCEQMLPEAAKKHLLFTYDGEHTSAVFDRKWTEEALANIADNAVKYTEKGRIAISCQAYDMFARIDISDTGPGISEEEIPKIFERFYRSPEAAQKEGVGLGLFLAREIIAAEGGYIKVSSARDRGSVFSVFLPRA